MVIGSALFDEGMGWVPSGLTDLSVSIVEATILVSEAGVFSNIPLASDWPGGFKSCPDNFKVSGAAESWPCPALGRQ